MGLDRPIDITADQKKTLLALLKRHLPNTTAWVYGSRVKWTARPQSDLDLVVFTTPDQERRVSDLRETFEESNLPFRVDLFVWDAVPEQFRKEIEAEHVVLVEKEEQSVAGAWKEERWGDLATLEYGRALRGYDTALGAFRVFGTNGPIGWHDEALYTHPSVIVGRKGAYRGIHYSAEPFFVIDTAFYLKPKVEMDVRWAYYELLTQDINLMDSGSAIPSTSREEFYSLPVLVPPLSEQRAIAHVLGTLDDKIELNRRMNETLEAMARALFKSWFIDFEPVRAKMAGRDPGLPQHLADLFPNRLVDSELGPIPEGWEATSLGKHVSNFDSKRVPVSKAERAKRQGPFPYHGAAGVMDHVDDYLFDGIYLLVGEDGSVSREGGLAVTQYVWGKFWVNNHAHVLQGKGPVSTEQVYLYFDFEPVAPYVTGAVQPKLSQSRMNNMPFLFPSTAICRAFTKAVSPWFTMLRACAAENKTLTELRDTLLPKLVSGKVSVTVASDCLDRRRGD